MLYPLIFKPIYKDYLWGGRALAKWGKTLPPQGKVAESWELSGHKNGESQVASGPLQGWTLSKLVQEFGRELVGTSARKEDLVQFPLLVKLIDAHDRLSVQVHPDDRYAARHAGQERGKSEMWYVLAAKPDAHLIAGVNPGTSRQDFAAAVARGDCLSRLQTIPVKAGDAINIPAGLVHAIGAGLIICEIQQSSDTTYRVYDYDRVGSDGQKRPLHLKEALDVIRFDLDATVAKVDGVEQIKGDLVRRTLVLNRYLQSEHWQLRGQASLGENGRRFLSLTVLSGEGKLTDPQQRFASVSLQQGRTVLIPAAVQQFELEGELEAVTATVSDFDRDLARLAQAANLPAQGLNRPAEWIASLRDRVGLEPLPDDDAN